MVVQHFGGQTMCIMGDGDVRMASVSKQEILFCSKISWRKSKILF